MLSPLIYQHHKPKEKLKLRIVIIDNDDTARFSLKKNILKISEEIFFEIEEQISDPQELGFLENNVYDCIFIGHSDKNDAAAILMKINHPDYKYNFCPCIVFTENDNIKDIIKLLQLGAQDYILKKIISPEILKISLQKAKEIFEIKRNWKQASEQIHNARKMEAIGQLTSGVSHDFNNLLTVIMGNVHLLRRRISGEKEKINPEDLQDKINAIDMAAVKGADLVRRLMVFTRQSPLAAETVNVNDLIIETFELLSRTLGEAIEIKTMLIDDPWPVSLDINEFENIMINFAINARDAMPKGGRLTIETDNVILDKDYIISHPEISVGEYVMIAISDTGIGMPPEVISKVFEPFFTTKEAGNGTGLGMSMAYGFVRQCGGHISVYSEVGHGTIFRIYLPKLSDKTLEETTDQDEMVENKNITILIVEDDETVADIAKTMIERLGYKTLIAHNSRLAFEMIKREHKNIDIIFTDIIMPGGMSGIELARQMREFYPDIKVLFTSGYSKNSIPDYDHCAGEHMISKPYRKDVLAQKLKLILSQDE